MSYYTHSKKIKVFSIVIFIINIVSSLLLGVVFQFSGEEIFQRYNWELAIFGVILSVAVYIIFGILVVNIVEAVEDITKAIDESIPIICSNKRRLSQILKDLVAETSASNNIHSQYEELTARNTWKCSICGRINYNCDSICKCGELNLF